MKLTERFDLARLRLQTRTRAAVDQISCENRDWGQDEIGQEKRAVDQFEHERHSEQRPRNPQLVCVPPVTQRCAHRRDRRQSWEQLSSLSGKLGKWQPETIGLPCWVRCFSTRYCHRTLRLRAPCGEPAKPVASAPRPAYFNCCAARISANLREVVASHSILTGQIENFSQAG